MMLRTRLLVLLTLACMLTVATTIHAAAKKPAPAAPAAIAPLGPLATPDADGFSPLFNGVDTNNWIGANAGYPVVDGVMVCQRKGGGNLYTRWRFADLHLKFDFKLTPGANNGLAFRTPPAGNPAVTCMELQILDNTAAQYAKLKPYQYHGSIYGLVPAKRGALKPVGQWNSQEVIGDGTKITVILNGQTITEADLSKLKIPAKGLASNCLRPAGHIGWAGHGAEIHFKNIKVKPIDTYDRGTHNTPPAGFTALFNGKDLTGWRGRPHLSPAKEAAMTPAKKAAEQAKWDQSVAKDWSVADGQIINKGKGVYLTTAKDYGDFEMMIDYKTVAKADSGIYLRANPQVQIWDFTKAGNKWKLGADKGSGGLWNNKKNDRFPAVLADKPFGLWNRMKIKIIGDKVTVHLNGEKIVDGVTMENFWDRANPLQARGPIQLQTHGGEIRWRNIFIREITDSK